jgi:RimJ/RimL family protein N-acetyltransferase
MANSHFVETSPSDILTLRRAQNGDLEAVMALERLPGYEALVGRSSRGEHEEMLASANYAYWLGYLDLPGPVAFAIVRDLTNVHGNVYLQRIAVHAPGKGMGTRFLADVIDRVFTDPAAHRFYLDCFLENARARRAYSKLGLTHDGILREAYLASDGTRRDLALMCVTRPEWTARQNSF